MCSDYQKLPSKFVPPKVRGCKVQLKTAKDSSPNTRHRERELLGKILIEKERSVGTEIPRSVGGNYSEIQKEESE